MEETSSTEIKKLRSEISAYCGQYELPFELRKMLSELDMKLKLAEYYASISGNDSYKSVPLAKTDLKAEI